MKGNFFTAFLMWPSSALSLKKEGRCCSDSKNYITIVYLINKKKNMYVCCIYLSLCMCMCMYVYDHTTCMDNMLPF